MTLKEVYEKYDGPWDVFIYDAKSKMLRESGLIYGVKTASERVIACYISRDTATLIALAPEMYAGMVAAEKKIGEDAKQNQSTY